MDGNKMKHPGKIVVAILIIGAIWGIFEATVGYLLHLLPISIGFLVWYPVAVFFLMTAHWETGRKPAILATAALAAAIKLLNLMLPGRIDRVINPAVSILLEALAVLASIYVFERVKGSKKAGGMLLVSIGMNLLWRALFLGYLAFLVPAWIREASVLKSGGSLLRFLVIDQLCSSLIVFAGMLLGKRLAERGVKRPRLSRRLSGFTRILVPVVLLALNIALQAALW